MTYGSGINHYIRLKPEGFKSNIYITSESLLRVIEATQREVTLTWKYLPPFKKVYQNWSEIMFFL